MSGQKVSEIPPPQIKWVWWYISVIPMGCRAYLASTRPWVPNPVPPKKSEFYLAKKIFFKSTVGILEV
jgi:hypothetical protein